MSSQPFQPAVEVTRGSLVESAHAAAIAVADPDGSLLASFGDHDRLIYLRSAAKPFQAAAALATGIAGTYGFTQEEIALISASHAGEAIHARTASSILARCGLEDQLVRAGQAPSVLMNNCSGKHAGMLAAAKAGGHSISTYLEPVHPVQRANLEAVSAFTGVPVSKVRMAVDGCSAPTFAVTLRETARAYARLVAAASVVTGSPALTSAAARVAAAMRACPEMISGEGMLDTILMRAIPGLVAKIGADGVHAMGWLGSRGPVGIAVKIMDGDSGKARAAVVLETLRQVGAVDGSVTLPESMTGDFRVRSLRGAEGGEIKAIFTLRRPV